MDCVDELFNLLRDGNLRVTFSRNCVSGLLPPGDCGCWRCCGIRPEDEHVDWWRVAMRVSLNFNPHLWDRELHGDHRGN